MNRRIMLLSLISVFIMGLGFRFALTGDDLPEKITRSEVYKNKMIAFCTPDWSLLNLDSLGNSITPLPGWGDYRWDIATPEDSARFYFNQGINMYYAFHIIESMASFKKAAQFDPDNPMVFWGQALAFGPNINDFAYTESGEAFALAQKAKMLSTDLPAKEKALIDAMSVRYSSDTSLKRETLNARYGEAMKKAYAKFETDPEVAVLYADALLVQHPWDYWKHNGDAQPWTPEILDVLEKILDLSPNHPGANHYYIHATEASTNPGRALASADRLGKLMPEVSHMVHMPSHIYIRTGNYDKGVQVNEMSINGYDKYLKLYPAVAANSPLYLIHNLHMQAACAMFKPNYARSLKSALAARNSFDTSFLSLEAPLGNFVQYVYMTPAIVNVRYGKWDEILQSPEISDSFAYAKVLWHWSMGMANANSGRLLAAKESLRKMKKTMKHPQLKIIMSPFNSAYTAALVGEQILQGTILEKSGDLKGALSAYREATDFEDALTYTEPRDWLNPTRHYLASALIKSGNHKEAEKILLEDLKQNPSNFYALQGLLDVNVLQKKSPEAAIIRGKLQEAFSNADMDKALLLY